MGTLWPVGDGGPADTGARIPAESGAGTTETEDEPAGQIVPDAAVAVDPAHHVRSATAHAEAVLHRTRVAVEPVLRAAVDTLPGRLRTIAAYHLGWEDAEGSAVDGIGGKLLRSGLVFAAAAAAGGPEPVADSAVLATAAAVELAHNFTLLHDDVIDRDRTRRHRPTAWTVFGAENAILAGKVSSATILDK